jgi:tRNA1(Val) A37 N6-methylase TrmN6
VLDFSAGYGGRLLGCLPLDRHYVGLDPCRAQVRGLREMAGRLGALAPVRARWSIHRACAEDFLPSLAAGSFALVFSSPPYFDRERYSEEPSQSYIRYPTYEGWLRGFLAPVLRECRRVLRPGGHLVVNVADVNGYRLTDDALRLASRHFTHARTLRLRLGHKPYLRGPAGGAFKYEPVFVFRKTRRARF